MHYCYTVTVFLLIDVSKSSHLLHLLRKQVGCGRFHRSCIARSEARCEQPFRAIFPTLNPSSVPTAVHYNNKVIKQMLTLTWWSGESNLHGRSCPSWNDRAALTFLASSQEDSAQTGLADLWHFPRSAILPTAT